LTANKENSARIDTAQIRQNYPVSEIVGRYVKLNKAGSELVGLCPFHGEKTPSFTVVDSKQFFHCHGCGATGDVIKFVMNMTGVDFRQAVEAITGETLPAATYVAPPADIPATAANDYDIITPVPDDAPALVTDGIATYFQHKTGEQVSRAVKRADEYRDAAGKLLGVVIRREWQDRDTGRTKKITPTITFCTGPNGFRGWVDRAFAEPRPLQGLDALSATAADVAVIIVEGEKAAAAARTLFPDKVVITWPNGGKAVSRAEWSELRGRKRIIIWPDADSHEYKTGDQAGQIKPWAEQEGARTAAEIATILHGLNSESITLGAPEGWPASKCDGWDAADVLAEGATPESAAIWMKDAIQRAIDAKNAEKIPVNSAPPVDPDYVPADYHPENETGYIPDPKDDTPFRYLGYDQGRFFYLPNGGGQIVELTAAQHTENNLFQLAGPDWWVTRYPSDKGKIDWQLVVSALIKASYKKGVFNPGRKRRGRGAWIDVGRHVFHLGDILWTDGELVPVPDFTSGFVYEQGEPMDVDLSNPLDNKSAYQVLEVAQAFRWENPLSAYLLAGFCVIAPVCGALIWRPNMWLVGPAGSGKTTVMKRFVNVLLGSTAFMCEGATTEAAIRAHMDSDARPVIFDEAEPKDTQALMRIRGILDLARVSSAGGHIHKGGADHKGKVFTVRSCFIFSSVNAAIEFHADDTRTTQLSLVGGNAHDQAEKDLLAARWRTLSDMLGSKITPEFAAGLIARTVRNLVTLQENCETFTAAAATHFGSMRAGDQYGPMLAGAYLLHSTGRIAYADALKWIQTKEFSFNAQGGADEGDERQLVNKILQHRERSSVRQGLVEDVSVSELIESAFSGDYRASDALVTLKRIGLKPDLKTRGLWIANQHDGLARVLKGTPWATGWARTLGGIPDAVKSSAPVYFTKYDKQRAVHISEAWLAPENA